MERWFMRRRKNRVLDIAYRQMTLSLDTVNDLERVVKAVLAGDREEARMIIERLFREENEADDLRRMVFEEVTKGTLPSPEREDIKRLVENLDGMADHIKDAARNTLILIDVEVPRELWEALSEMSSGITKTAAVLRDSLRSLSEDPGRARVLSERVEDEETVVDGKFLEVKSLLLKHGEKVNPSILIIVKDLADSMEEAADSCAATGDYIRVLTVSYK